MLCRCGKQLEAKQGVSTCSCGSRNKIHRNGDLGFILTTQKARAGFRVVKNGELRKR